MAQVWRERRPLPTFWPFLLKATVPSKVPTPTESCVNLTQLMR
jgi:hypothetical protein